MLSRKGEKRSRNLAISQRAEKSKKFAFNRWLVHLLVLLLLLAIIAFSIHQLLILRFLKARCLCYSASLAHKQFMRLLLVFAFCFIGLAFCIGQYIVMAMQCLKNSAWTESMNMRLSGVTITFFRNFVG